MPGLWQVIRPDKALKGIRQIWNQMPDGWYKNPYAWAGVVRSYSLPCLPSVVYNGMNTEKNTGG